MGVDRRGFLRLAALGTAGGALVVSQPAAAVTALAIRPERPVPPPMEPVNPATTFDARPLSTVVNDLIERVNYLTATDPDGTRH